MQLHPVEGNSSTKDSGSVGNGSAVKEPKQQKARSLVGRGLSASCFLPLPMECSKLSQI